MTKDIIDGIREYASAYDRFQRFQDTHRDHLPLGEQKTGVIGEFYAMLLLAQLTLDAPLLSPHQPKPGTSRFPARAMSESK